jgi:uncharacterized protein YjbI with pentapeptide repeats
MVAVVVGVFVLLCALVVAVRQVRRDRGHPDTVPRVTTLVVVGIVAMTVGAQPGRELKTVLTTAAVGAGLVTAIFALWLNHRRYRVEEARQQVERDKADLDQSRHRLEQQKVELEQAKERREHDKDDILIRAVELFGHADMRVRCGALHTIAAFATQRPARAADVVRLVSMYLRTMPDDDPAAIEAQRVLSRVVADANAAGVEDLEVDLTGASLTDLVLDDVAVRVLTVAGAHLAGVTSLRGLGSVAGTVRKGQANCRVDLTGAVFAGDVRLHGAHLKRLSAQRAEFHGDLSLASSWVELDVVLSDSAVAGDTDFRGAEFGKLAANATTFHGEATFRRVTVRGAATFLQAHFTRADFEKFTTRQQTVFDEAHFADAVLLPEALPSLRRTTVGAKAAEDLPTPWRTKTISGVHYLVHTRE